MKKPENKPKFSRIALSWSPDLAVVTNEEDFVKLSSAHNLEVEPWLGDHAQACVHGFNNNAFIVVCLRPDDDDVDSTIVHESVHVFQRICRYLGEDEPSKEFQAYGLQYIFEHIRLQYHLQMQTLKKTKSRKKK